VRTAIAAALLLVCAGSALVLDHERNDSPTMDEPFHCHASAEYVLSGTYYANLEHPPLTKLLAGVSLALAGARAPRIPLPFSGRTAEMPRDYCYSASVPPNRFFAAARRPFLVLYVLLVLTAALSVGLRAGAWAGVAVAALLSFEPNLVAHAGIVHTDLAAAFGFLLTLFLAVRALERRSLLVWAATGLGLGLSLASKFSAILLVPVLVLLAVIELVRAARSTERPAGPDLRPFGGLLLCGGMALATLWAAYAFAMRAMSGDEAEHAVRVFLTQAQVPAETIERVAGLTRISPELGHYVAGLTRVALQNRVGGGVNVFHGRLSSRGFWNYFLVAFLVKSSLAFLGLIVLACGAAVWKRARPDALAVAYVLGAAVLVLASLGSSYNIGIRHILPVYPLLACAAVIILVRALPARHAAAALSLVAALQLAAVWRVHPHELSFFNMVAGGPKHGARWLNDSNLDWGQDLIRLAAELEKRGLSEQTTVAYFGGAYLPAYCASCREFDPLATPLSPGTYAVSSFIWTAGPELMLFRGDTPRARGFQRLRSVLARRGEPLGTVGYSILLYRLPPEGSSHR
jgi:Dolichyl-phosphate-mannose-protein mannosyltransferase